MNNIHPMNLYSILSEFIPRNVLTIIFFSFDKNLKNIREKRYEQNILYAHTKNPSKDVNNLYLPSWQKVSA